MEGFFEVSYSTTMDSPFVAPSMEVAAGCISPNTGKDVSHDC